MTCKENDAREKARLFMLVLKCDDNPEYDSRL